MVGPGAVTVYSRAACLGIARTCLRTARNYLPGGIWESWGEDACALGLVLELTKAIAWRDLARNPAREAGPRGSYGVLLEARVAPRKAARAKEAKRRELELDLGDFACKPEEPASKQEPWRPPPVRNFAGQWHWDDARGSIDAVIAHMPEDDAFAGRLDRADAECRADSNLVYRWGVELGRLWGLPDPCAYGSALTDSAAICRPSLSTRQALGDPAEWTSAVNGPSPKDWWDGMVQRARIQRGQPIGDECVPGQEQSWGRLA